MLLERQALLCREASWCSAVEGEVNTVVKHNQSVSLFQRPWPHRWLLHQ